MFAPKKPWQPAPTYEDAIETMEQEEEQFYERQLELVKTMSLREIIDKNVGSLPLLIDSGAASSTMPMPQPQEEHPQPPTEADLDKMQTEIKERMARFREMKKTFKEMNDGSPGAFLQAWQSRECSGALHARHISQILEPLRGMLAGGTAS